MTGPQTLEIPPLHTTLETFTNPEQLSAGASQVEVQPGSRFSNDIHILPGNKMNSGECGSCIVSEVNERQVTHERTRPHRLGRGRLE